MYFNEKAQDIPSDGWAFRFEFYLPPTCFCYRPVRSLVNVHASLAQPLIYKDEVAKLTFTVDNSSSQLPVDSIEVLFRQTTCVRRIN